MAYCAELQPPALEWVRPLLAVRATPQNGATGERRVKLTARSCGVGLQNAQLRRSKNSPNGLKREQIALCSKLRSRSRAGARCSIAEPVPLGDASGLSMGCREVRRCSACAQAPSANCRHKQAPRIIIGGPDFGKSSVADCRERAAGHNRGSQFW